MRTDGRVWPNVEGLPGPTATRRVADHAEVADRAIVSDHATGMNTGPLADVDMAAQSGLGRNR